MAALTFTLRANPPERLDLSPLVPARLAGLDRARIEALVIGTSRAALTVGDVFQVSGDDPAEIRIEGGSDRLDFVGAGLKAGAIRVSGDVGAYLGRGMVSGTITVDGSVHGPHAAAGMKSGALHVAGDVVDALGGAVPGAMHGMAGGLVVVGGSAGAYVGDRMRRGVIVVLGSAGEAAGARMIGGTILAARLGTRAGDGMKRGTLVAGAVDEIEPGFVSAGDYSAAFLGLLQRWIRREAGAAAADLVPTRADRWRGDMATGGKGELIVG